MPQPSRHALLALAGLLLAYLALGYWIDYRCVPRWYRELHASRLHGRIRWRSAGKAQVSLCLDNDEHTFRFCPLNKQGNVQASNFIATTTPGDSLYKAAGSDTLCVRAAGRVVVFIAEQPRWNY